MRSILFVCTANICRSPMAEATLRSILAARGFDATDVQVDSAGTHDYQAGHAPCPLAVETAKRRGYSIGGRVARRIRPEDFDRFDHILVMDGMNLAHLKTICPTRCKQKVELLLEYGDTYHGKEIADPYGRQAKDYDRALDMIEDGCRGLAQLLARAA